MSFQQRVDPWYWSAKRWFSLQTILIAILPVLFLGFHRIDSADIWVHLAAGRDIVETARVPTYDPFASSDREDVEWINSQWGADVFLFLLYRMGGSGALVVFAALLGAIALALPPIWAWKRRDPLWPYLTAVLLATLILCERLMVRPELLGYVLLAFYTQKMRQDFPETRRSWAGMILLQILWSNAHASFVLGPILIALAIISNRLDCALRFRRGKQNVMRVSKVPMTRGLIFFLLMCISSFVTPYGYKLPIHVVHAWKDLGSQALSRGVVEWQPTFSSAVWGDLPLMVFVVSLAIGCVALWRARRVVKTFDLLVVIAMIALATNSRRHLALYAVSALPIVAGWVWAGWNSAQEDQLRDMDAARHAKTIAPTRSAAVFSAILTFLALFYATDVLRGHFYRRFGPPRTMGWDFSKIDHPMGAAQFVAENELHLGLFNNIAAGSCLLWFAPNQVDPVIDGRLLPNALPFAQYRRFLNSGVRFETYARQRNIQLAVFGLQPHPPTPLFRSLYDSSEWQLVFLDGEGAVFVSGEIALQHPEWDSINLERPLRHVTHQRERQTFWQPCDPGESAVRGLILARIGYPVAAQADLSQALLLCPDRWDLGLALSSAFLDTGKHQAARQLVERSLEQAPNRARAWTNLGRCFMAEGNQDEARRCLQHAEQLNPPDPQATRLLRQLQE